MDIPDELNALLAALKLTGKEPAWKFSASTDQVTVQLTWTKAKKQEASSCKPKPALKSKPPSTRRRDARRFDQWMANKTAVVPAAQIQQTTITQTEARDSVVGHVLTPTKYKGESVGVVVNRDIVTSPYTQKRPAITWYSIPPQMTEASAVGSTSKKGLTSTTYCAHHHTHRPSSPKIPKRQYKQPF
ncbi:unnamed protein product [Mytilus edulis]|uniref:Uncharacterized protein n=1 Tax=Mytilus edulis TaxID=6550 RepID=A0A8S3QIX9_MYTED|nr:unnamed protein product [Mytilus edulis]